MNYRNKIFLIFFILTFHIKVYAGSLVQAKITEVEVVSEGKMIVSFDRTISYEKNNCAANQVLIRKGLFDISTVFGSAAAFIVRSSISNRNYVYVSIGGGCDVGTGLMFINEIQL